MSARDRMFTALSATPGSDAPGPDARNAALSALHARLDALHYHQQPGDVESFIGRARESGSTVVHCTDAKEAAHVIAELVEPGGRAILSDDPLLATLGLRAMLPEYCCQIADLHENADQHEVASNNGDRQARRAYASAPVGITVARVGLADSGAILVFSSECESRSVSLLPERHVAILPAERIVPSLWQAAELLRQLAGAETSAVTLIGGPSKTADIEKVLVTGVHGPGELVIVIVDDAEGQ